MGETAPLIILAPYTTFINFNLFNGPMAALPTLIYTNFGNDVDPAHRPHVGRGPHADPVRPRPQHRGPPGRAIQLRPPLSSTRTHVAKDPFMAQRIDCKDVNIYYGSFKAVEDVSMAIEAAVGHGLHRPVRAAASPPSCGP